MAGFFKKLIGKKEQEKPQQDTGGSWADHEVSVDIQAEDVVPEPQAKSQALAEQSLAIETEASKHEKVSQPNQSDKDSLGDTQPIGTVDSEDSGIKEPELQQNQEVSGDTIQTPIIEIASIDTADLKYAMDQAEPPKEIDPLDEITAQIQLEIAAEKSEREKKATLEKLKEVTSQLKRPDFDEDFDV